MSKQDTPKTSFPKGREKSAFPAAKKTAAKQPQHKPQTQKDTFPEECLAYLAAHKERFGEVCKAAPASEFVFECIRRDAARTRIYHIAVTQAPNAGAALVEKTAQNLEALLAKSAPDACGHQAVLMAPTSFSADAQSAAVVCNVLLIAVRNMKK
ncbi:MAG TPA: hypothetical protein O0X70_02480 [Methanocorpusculum sp.]|nr:hypothetical protein [Methanocorpusculum sp.]